MKKIIKLLAIIFISVFIVGCGSKEYELPNLEDKTKNEIIAEFNSIDSEIVVNFEYELAKGTPEGVFVKYQGNSIGDKVAKDKQINVVLSKDKLRLPNLNLKTKSQIQDIFTSLLETHNELEIKLEYKYELNESLAEGVFIKYETFEVGTVIEENKTISIVLSADKYRLPNLEGKTKEEIETAINNSLTDFSYLELELEFKYEFSENIEENLFVKYENVKAGDAIYSNQKIVIILSSPKYRLPNLEGKTKTEIDNIFADLKIDFPNLDVELKYQYEYRSNLLKDSFIEYGNNYKAADVINEDIELIITLSDVYYYPSLEELTRSETISYFNNINSEYEEANLLVNFIFVYDETNELGTILGYKTKDLEGKPIKTNSIIDVLISTYQKAPDLIGKTEQEIKSIFNSYKLTYSDFELDLNFIYVYDYYVQENTFIRYENSIVKDSPLPSNGSLDIFMAKHKYQLPDFSGLTKKEIEDYFDSFEIPLDKLDFRAVPGYDVEPSTFIKYNNAEIGDSYNFASATKLVIMIDNAVELPNLEGMNKHQIISDLDSLGIKRVIFNYTLNEDKEYDLFSSYGGSRKVGDYIYNDEDLEIILYMNAFVNTKEWGVFNERELFISKYIDGAENGQGLELFNATYESIDLSDYYIAILSGGSYLPTRIVELEGTLEPNQTYVIMNDKSSQAFLNKADLITDEMKFGGNDNIQLRRTSNNTYIDSIYEVGNINILMDKEIFVRRSDITHGRRNYIYREWMGFVPDYDEIIGVHPVTGYADPVFELIEDKTFQEYGMTKVKYIRAADGDTVYFENLEPDRDPASYDGDNRVRFLLVNTPEIGEPYKQTAQSFTENMLKNASEIYIQSSEEAKLTETYGRHLGLVWANIGTIENPNWKLVNYEILKAGLGIIMIAKSGKYQNHPIFGGRYLYQWAADADEYAKENNLGLYSGFYQP